MEEFFIRHGLLTLFCLSLLASTILPLGSEWLLVALLLNGHNPALSIVTATVGNTLGAVTTYWIGIWGAPFLIEKVLGIGHEKQQRAERLFARYGTWSLLFSWVPVVGDTLCLVGGALKIRFERFLFLVFSGKFIRYIVVGMFTLKIFVNE